MAQDQTKKEALFNEVKGSLFEYLVGRRLASLGGDELSFIEKLDKNYLNVLSQQDRMIRQFYPGMLPFLNDATRVSVDELIKFLKETPRNPQLMGKFINSSLAPELHETDLLLETSKGSLPLSLKLNKKNAFVNTKSGGIKSFFNQYFSFLNSSIQEEFNRKVDQEFTRMSYELYALNDLEYNGDFSQWVKMGKSELPGELNGNERAVLKSFYARIAFEMHEILSKGLEEQPELFQNSLPALMGFSEPSILQLICFHDFKGTGPLEVMIHGLPDISVFLQETRIKSFGSTSSVEIEIGNWALHIRVKPMNKFTTTAIKINCSVKFKRSCDV